MALIDSVQYWDKNESIANLITPDIGDFTGTIVGSISFELVKYINGAIVDNRTSGLYYGRSDIAPNSSRYVIEWWVKWKVSSGVWSQVNFFCGDRQFLTYHGISFRLNANKTWRLQIKDGAGDSNFDSAAISFAQDQVDHIELIIDSAASFDGVKTFSVRRNGVEEHSGTRAMNFVTLDPSYGFYGAIVGGGASFVEAAVDVAFDNPKIYDETGIAKLADIEANKNNEGFPTPTYTIPVRTKTLPEYIEKIVLDNDPDFDLVRLGLVKQFPSFKYKKTFDRRLAITNELNIPIININDYLSLDNPKSVFNGVDWKGMNIKLTDKFGIDVWEGYIEEITRNHRDKSGVLKCKSKFYRYRELFVDYTSGVWENPIAAFNSIISKYEVPGINTRSADISEAYLSGNVTIKVISTLEKQKKLIEVLEEIAKYSGASLYFYNGEIYVQVWQPNENLAVDISIEESDLKLEPIVETPDRMLINDYIYGYDGDGGTPTRDSDNDDIGALSREKFISRPSEIGQSDFVAFENATSAQFVGEQKIRSTNRNLSTDPKPLTRAAFSVNLSEYRRFIELSSFIRLTFSDEAWDGKIFEVFEMDLNYESDTLGIVAYENVV